MIQIISANPTPDPEGGPPYDRLCCNMSTSPTMGSTAIGAAVSIKFTPFREVDGEFQYYLEGAKPVVFGNAFEAVMADADVAAAMGAILTALQTFVTAKGL